jgi:Na+/H+ antiporter NhaA
MARPDAGLADRTAGLARWLPGRSHLARSETPSPKISGGESMSAVVLVAAVAVALIWANLDPAGYAGLWQTPLSVGIGGWVLSMSLVDWINSGLMTLFFFVVGLEARREFDVGELRERRRAVLPLAAGLGGMAAAVAVFLALNAGHPSAPGWGAAMSTDTAFALGALALAGPLYPQRLRAFLVTVLVADDALTLIVITAVYARNLAVVPLVVALVLFGLIVLAVRLRLGPGWIYLVGATALWVAVKEAGVDPLIVGLAMGLLTYASPPARADLERASLLFRGFREQPTPELARLAGQGLRAAVSPNERLQVGLQRWTGYVVVPLFALANAGITLSGPFLLRAYTSPVTLGIILGYVVGKPVGVFVASWLTARLSLGRLRPPVGWGAVLGTGTLVGIGFTVSILVASIVLRGEQLQQAKLGVLTTVVLGGASSWVLFRVVKLLPRAMRARWLLGTSTSITDLASPVDPARDHVRGPREAPVTLVEYGDFECPYCGQAEPSIRTLLAELGDLRYVWRHLPLDDVHPRAQLAAEAAEAASSQGAFWAMHDLLFDHQDQLRPADLVGYAQQLGLDLERFQRYLDEGTGADRVAQDRESAELSGVSGTPSFFINGMHHRGAYDLQTLSQAVKVARIRAGLGVGAPAEA